MKESAGEIIAFTDDDCVVSDSWLGEINKAFNVNKCLGIGGKILAKWMCEIPAWFTSGDILKSDNPLVFFDVGNEIKSYDSKTLLPTGNNSAFKREAFEKYGYFRTDLGRIGSQTIGSEDSEFCRRLLKGGNKLLYIPTLSVFHKAGTDKLNKKYFKRWFFYSGRTTVKREGVLKSKSIKYFKVPRWLYRELLMNFFGFVTNIFSKKGKCFYCQLKMHRTIGQMYEYIRTK